MAAEGSGVQVADSQVMLPFPLTNETDDDDNEGSKTCVFVGNLAPQVTESNLKDFFVKFGTVLELYINFGFASVQMASSSSAENAVRQLDGLELYGKNITVKVAPVTTNVKINTSLTSIKVENLSPMVTNERLHEAFTQFGEVLRAIVIVDSKGQSTTRGIVEFKTETSAQNAVKKIEEGSFLTTTFPKPLTARLMDDEDSVYGLPEEKITKTTEYFEETKAGPRFASMASFEAEMARTFKIRYEQEKQQRQQFEENIKSRRLIFEAQMRECWKKQQLALQIKQEVLSHEEGDEERKNEFEARKRIRMEAQIMELYQSQTQGRNADETPTKRVKYNEEEEPITVSELKRLKLFGLSEEQKVMLKARGRPTPKLALTQDCMRNGKMSVRNFRTDWYERKKWMCGCKESCALYCFPCILLGGEPTWTSSGYTNIAKLSERSARHEQSNTHSNNMMYFELLGKVPVSIPPPITWGEHYNIGSSNNDENSNNNGEAKNKIVVKRFVTPGFEEEKKAKAFLIEHKLLRQHHRCERCNGICTYSNTGGYFRCNATSDGKRCNYTKGEFKGTLFASCKIKLADWLKFVKLFLSKDFSMSRVITELTWAKNTVTRWSIICGQICQEYSRKQEPIGGPETIVEVDEMYMCERKYDFGRVVKQYWILGGRERGSNTRVLWNLEGKSRTAANVIPLIEKHVRKGSIIITDSHHSYNSLDKHDYGHQIATNPSNVVCDAARTVNLENMYDDMKEHLNDKSSNICIMSMQISRYILISSFEDEEERLHNFLQSAVTLYPFS